jgi:hypothetical protein
MATDAEIVELPDCPKCKEKNSVQLDESTGLQEHGPQVVKCAHCDEPYPVEVHGGIVGDAFKT